VLTASSHIRLDPSLASLDSFEPQPVKRLHELRTDAASARLAWLNTGRTDSANYCLARSKACIYTELVTLSDARLMNRAFVNNSAAWREALAATARAAQHRYLGVAACAPVQCKCHLGWSQARNQLGRRVFWGGPKLFELCPIFLNNVQHIFPRGGGGTILGGVSSPWLRAWKPRLDPI